MYDMDELTEIEDYGELEDLDELDDDELDADEFEVEQAKKAIRIVRSAARKAVAAVKAGVPPKTAAKKAIKAAVKKQILKSELDDDEVDSYDEFEFEDDTEPAMELASMRDDEEMEQFLGALIGGARTLLTSPIARQALGHVARMGTRLAGQLLSGSGPASTPQRRIPQRRYRQRRPYYRRRMPRHRRRRAVCIFRAGNWVPIRYLA